MPKKTFAFIVVSKEWMNTGVRILLNSGKKSTSASESHLIIAPYDKADGFGVWIHGVESSALRVDGSVTRMDFLIPWSAILGFGVEESSKKLIGFATGTDTTIFGVDPAVK